jgi:hypothetical protein
MEDKVMATQNALGQTFSNDNIVNGILSVDYELPSGDLDPSELKRRTRIFQDELRPFTTGNLNPQLVISALRRFGDPAHVICKNGGILQPNPACQCKSCSNFRRSIEEDVAKSQVTHYEHEERLPENRPDNEL